MAIAHERSPRGTRRWLAVLPVAVLLVAVGCSSAGSPRSSKPGGASGPWSAAQLIRPAELAAMLEDTTGEKPLLLHVGFKVLYRAGAIPGTRYVGAGSRPEGIAALRREVRDVPRARGIVLYCGCCPWDHCPNMHPAFRTLREMGFKNVRALYIAKDLDTDWVNAGYPIEKPRD